MTFQNKTTKVGFLKKYHYLVGEMDFLPVLKDSEYDKYENNP